MGHLQTNLGSKMDKYHNIEQGSCIVLQFGALATCQPLAVIKLAAVLVSS